MKTITCKNINGMKFNVRKTGDSVKFYDYDTRRAYVRKLWVDFLGEPYVWFSGEFRSLSQAAMTDSGIPFVIGHYGVC